MFHLNRIIVQILLLMTVNFWPVLAQNDSLPLKIAVKDPVRTLGPEALEQLQWLPKGDSFVYVKDRIVHRQDHKGTTATFAVAQINAWLGTAGLPTIGKIPTLNWLNSDELTYWQGDSLIKVNFAANKASLDYRLPRGAGKKEFCTSNGATAFVLQNNLHIQVAGREPLRVTADSLAGIINGDYAHRREFGIKKGIFWSNSGNAVAFYRKDERLVADYPHVDYNTTPALLKTAKYPMAGMTNHIAQIGVYHLDSKKLIWLETGEPQDQYLTNITWSPAGKFILLAHINRDQNHLRMIRYDAASGKRVNTVFEEKEENYLDPQTGPVFAPDNPEVFFWLSQRSGWNHLYAYHVDGRFEGAITSGRFDITELLGFDQSGKTAYFVAAHPDPLQRNVYRVDCNSGDIRRITSGEGTHGAKLSNNGQFLLVEFSALSVPGITTLMNLETGASQTLLLSENPLKNYRLGRTKLEPVRLASGDTLIQHLIFPPDFDEKKRYPLIVYVYGGPHSQLVRKQWKAGPSRWIYWLNYLATQGFVVLSVDNRGTYYRGKAFEQATFRKLGTIEVADQVAVVRQLATKPFIDDQRIGVVGWSYGGFMTASLMLRAPDLFKVGISGAPVIDWKYYETVYTERYMDTPVENPDGYRESSVLSYVDQLKGKLLLIHGTSDPVVMWQNTIVFLKAAIDAGVQADYFVYPGHKHSISPGDRLHLYQKMTDYFRNNL